MERKTQEASSAVAGMSVRSGRKWESGPLPSQSRVPHTWRTRPDPFAKVFDAKIVPFLEADTDGILQAKTLLEELIEKDPGQFKPGQLRTLQRRVRDWRAVHGPEREVYFQQEHPPGREGAMDFTHASDLSVTIAGEKLEHLFFVFKLSFSGWLWVMIAFGETYEALLEGIQGALWELGGVPEILRSDNLSAATHDLRKKRGRALNQRFAQVLEHYGLRSTRITPGRAHENGVAEKANDLFKSAVAQALVLRGSRDFESQEAYEEFLRRIVARHNQRVNEAVDVERAHLQDLPSASIPNYTSHEAVVRRWSTIRVNNRTYSVPSRLIGHTVRIRLCANHLEVYYADKRVEMMPRLRGEKEVRIDYRHIIWSLIRKPGAFARYRWREELFPTLIFRRVYDALCGWRGERADVEYVRILHLAASTLESQVERSLAVLLESGTSFDYAAVKAAVQPEPTSVPILAIGTPDLTAYDRLLVGGTL